MARKRKSKSWQLQWTEEAVDSLWKGWSFVASQNEEAADRMIQEIQARVEHLLEHPSLGPVVPELQEEKHKYRQLLVLHWPYRVIYRTDEELRIIWILRVHPARIPLDFNFEEE